MCGFKVPWGFTDKVKAATKRGAAAVLLVNNDSPISIVRGACDDICKTAILAMLLSTLVTGHGFNDSKSCAEFCDTVHHVTVNGTDFTLSNPVAEQPLGCFEQVNDGVIPNQAGTWVYGRNNWCPGTGVKLWNADLSMAASGEGPHTLTYKALVDGVDHVSVLNGADRDASIHMTSWLVYYAERGAAVPEKPVVKQ